MVKPLTSCIYSQETTKVCKWYLSFFFLRKSFVPQGSVLGPFFLLYLNYINTIVTNESLRLLNDDTVFMIHHTVTNCTTLVSKVHSVLEHRMVWFDANKFTLRLGKTNFSIFHTEDRIPHACPDHFTINDDSVCKTDCAKYLGLFSDWRSVILQTLT